jgi:hypothetical protein
VLSGRYSLRCREGDDAYESQEAEAGKRHFCPIATRANNNRKKNGNSRNRIIWNGEAELGVGGIECDLVNRI